MCKLYLILRGMFEYSENVTGHVSRNRHRLFIPQVWTSYGQKCLFYRGTVASNNINNILYSVCNLNSFKPLYKLLHG